MTNSELSFRAPQHKLSCFTKLIPKARPHFTWKVREVCDTEIFPTSDRDTSFSIWDVRINYINFLKYKWIVFLKINIPILMSIIYFLNLSFLKKLTFKILEMCWGR